MIYKQYKSPITGAVIGVQIQIDPTLFKSFQFDPNNPDYRQFKIDMSAGATLNDPNGAAITGAQLTSFLTTLP